jgi:ABC-2 type transport system ATP-binding protein
MRSFTPSAQRACAGRTYSDLLVAVVRARRITKRFETTVALESVDLQVESGEVRGLLGPNGAGKTTLLRILFGLLLPDSGSVELLGRARGSGRCWLDEVAGFVEEPRFYPYLSGRANLELLGRLDGGVPMARIDGALERVGLHTRAGDRVNGYSTGMRQRLGIAAALIRAPRLLLLDEPTAGLDPAGVRDMASLVKDLRADGVAILLSSHQIAEVEEVCQSFTFLRGGHVAWDGTAARLRSEAPASDYALATSDDRRALEIAQGHRDIDVRADEEGGLVLRAEEGRLDPYVLALGQAGVAVRRLELRVGPLEAMFFELTGQSAGESADTDGTALAAVVSA